MFQIILFMRKFNIFIYSKVITKVKFTAIYFYVGGIIGIMPVELSETFTSGLFHEEGTLPHPLKEILVVG